MKRIVFQRSLASLLLLVGLTGSLAAQTTLSEWLDRTDRFFQNHVNNGRVDYAAIQAQPKALNALVRDLASPAFAQLKATDRKAFQINAYNLLVIHQVVDHYPVKSPMDIGGFFDQTRFEVAGRKMTLNQLEKEELFPATKDARLHFVLVCGAIGCPSIAPFAYRPATLDQQLDERTRNALNDPAFVRVNPDKQEVALSEIFQWYKQDFTGSGKTVRDYINGYRQVPIGAEVKLGSYTYDWTLNDREKTAEAAGSVAEEPPALSNVQAFTPSVLLKQGQIEVNIFNNLYTQTVIRDREGDDINLSGRESFLTSTWQFTYGISKNARINVGLDVTINSAYFDANQGSPFSLFTTSEGGFHRTVVSGIGPRIKVTPFRSLGNLSIQSTLLFPVASDLESPNFTAHDRYTWNTQIFYDQRLSEQFRLFLEADFLYRIKANSDQLNFFRTPLTAILSYFPTGKSTVYAMIQHAPAYGNATNGFDTDFGRIRWFSQAGLGAKYQVTRQIGLEVSVTDFFASRSDGAGSTYNFGIRFIR
ncbi:MAG: DUF547 domain-containing protein [Bacteroidota bacterium]